jgi:6-phosphogluconolactonase
MNIEVFETADEVARRAAAIIAGSARAAVEARGRFVFAVSGGSTPAGMFRALSRERLPWNAVHLFQVDERIAPEGDADRNFIGLRTHLLAHVPLPGDQVHPMPVEAPDLIAAASEYSNALARATAGSPSTLDLVHLGLGEDGHTASLISGDAALDVIDHDVAVTGEYNGRRRMTLTLPSLNRARAVLWVVTGSGKAAMLSRLLDGDTSIPAGRVSRANAYVVADRGALPQSN